VLSPLLPRPASHLPLPFLLPPPSPSAWLTVPNVVFRPFGKFLFCAVDMIIGALTSRILQMRGLSARSAAVHASLFLFSPVVVNVTTRGNADSIVCALVLATVYFLMRQEVRAAAVCFGLSVHVKIFPIVYALPLVLFLDEHYAPLDFPLILRSDKAAQRDADAVEEGGVTSGGGVVAAAAVRARALVAWLHRFLTWRRVEFGLLSGGVFVALTAVLYALYGWTFLYETYLYHFVRTDNRHNFSPYFYDLLLRYDRPSRAGMGLLTFLPQFGTVLALGGLYYRDLPFCLFIQTLAFVTFNKVVTAQYFHWYFALLPLMTPQTTLTKGQAFGLFFVWIASELHWNVWSGYLELLGQSTFFPVWVAGLLFFAANILVLAVILRAHTFAPVFEAGRLVLIGPPAEGKGEGEGEGEDAAGAGPTAAAAGAGTGRKKKAA
jgi:GPI mannosyltransferase 1 subunit M